MKRKTTFDLTPWFIAAVLLTLVGLLTLPGCAVQPKSFEDRLAYAYGTHTAVMNATTNALVNNEISSTEAREVAAMADDTRLILDAAYMANGLGDLSTAEGKLVLGTNVLIQLQRYLRARGST